MIIRLNSTITATSKRSSRPAWMVGPGQSSRHLTFVAQGVTYRPGSRDYAVRAGAPS